MKQHQPAGGGGFSRQMLMCLAVRCVLCAQGAACVPKNRPQETGSRGYSRWGGTLGYHSYWHRELEAAEICLPCPGWVPPDAAQGWAQGLQISV